MMTAFADPYDALLSLQRELEASLSSDWLQDRTTSRGPFPPINLFQQGDDILVIVELPGVDKSTLTVPVNLDPDRVKAEYRDGILALFLPRAETDKPRTVKID